MLEGCAAGEASGEWRRRSGGVAELGRVVSRARYLRALNVPLPDKASGGAQGAQGGRFTPARAL